MRRAASNQPHPTTIWHAVPFTPLCPPTTSEFCEIIAEFESRMRQKSAAMREAFSERDFDELAQLAHWLKGSGGTAGFHAFTDLAKELEQLARTGGADEQIEAILSEIEIITRCIVVPDIVVHTSH